MLSLIYARSENFCIGRAGELPWRLPADFRHFKRTTMGCPIIMGRRTYEDHQTALPGRLNIVVTRQADYQAAEGIVICPSLEAAIDLAKARSEHYFVTGGAGLYAAAFPLADRVYETVVHTEVEGDTFLQPLDFAGWTPTLLHVHPADAKHAYPFTVTRYDRLR